MDDEVNPEVIAEGIHGCAPLVELRIFGHGGTTAAASVVTESSEPHEVAKAIHDVMRGVCAMKGTPFLLAMDQVLHEAVKG